MGVTAYWHYEVDCRHVLHQNFAKHTQKTIGFDETHSTHHKKAYTSYLITRCYELFTVIHKVIEGRMTIKSK